MFTVKKIKIILPIWNCTKCMVVRKVELNKFIRTNIENFEEDLDVEIFLCNENTQTQNVTMISQFSDIIKNILPDIKLRMMLRD